MATATSLKLLTAYGSDSDSDETNKEEESEKAAEKENKFEAYEPVDPSMSIASSISINSAPVVLYSVILNLENITFILY